MTFNKKIVQEELMIVEMFAEGSKSGGSSSDESTNTGACKNNTTVNVGGCA